MSVRKAVPFFLSIVVLFFAFGCTAQPSNEMSIDRQTRSAFATEVKDELLSTVFNPKKWYATKRKNVPLFETNGEGPGGNPGIFPDGYRTWFFDSFTDMGTDSKLLSIEILSEQEEADLWQDRAPRTLTFKDVFDVLPSDKRLIIRAITKYHNRVTKTDELEKDLFVVGKIDNQYRMSSYYGDRMLSTGKQLQIWWPASR